MTFKKTITCVLLMLVGLTANAQRFFNLTAQEVRIDTLLPAFHYAHPLGEHYADSTYTVAILYPEFIDMSPADIERYQQLSGRPLGELPEIYQSVSVSRKQGTLHIGFVPLVYRDGKYQKLVSFKLEVRGLKAEERGLRAEGRRLKAAAGKVDRRISDRDRRPARGGDMYGERQATVLCRRSRDMERHV